MIIRNDSDNSIAAVSLFVGVCLGALIAWLVDSIALSLLIFAIVLVLYFILVRVIRYLQGKYWGDIVAVSTEENIKINNKTLKWEAITRWNMQTNAIQGFSFMSVIFNCFVGSYSRTFYISTPNKTIVVNDAPKRLQKCFEKYAPNAYDEKFVIKEPKNKVT